MQDDIKRIFDESLQVKKKTRDVNAEKIQQVAELILKIFQNNGKVIIFGNGGSAADSQHMAAEFIGRFQKERQSLPVIALTTDTSALTALGNDYGFDIVFARQLEGLGQKQDLAIGLSTSGNSRNVIEAIKVAKSKGMSTISLTGCQGGALAELTDINIDVPSTVTARIQEAHIVIVHCICELVENNI
ncbi:MAG: D-sedoheptulose 7-phosphate isomerase [Candidatus Omnitrophica bacterium]|nr:D-sedoheptulose 7-phosphate isomerase [Candidatus Omnitrophota bacterium]